jgi:hypothetical protein
LGDHRLILMLEQTEMIRVRNQLSLTKIQLQLVELRGGETVLIKNPYYSRG